MKRRLPAAVAACHGPPMARLDFWYEFASTYSHLAAQRIEPLAKAAGIALSWRPFLLGPIFKTQGMETSPFNLYPLKGKYMWRDMERWSESLQLPKFMPPKVFPANALAASRVALALDDDARPDFTRAVYRRGSIPTPDPVGATATGSGRSATTNRTSTRSPPGASMP